eukprot:scaffold66388_cov52-Attheya_sp.AAC.3
MVFGASIVRHHISFTNLEPCRFRSGDDAVMGIIRSLGFTASGISNYLKKIDPFANGNPSIGARATFETFNLTLCHKPRAYPQSRQVY